MKKGIHPKYYPEAKVICACGNTWTTGSTQEEIRTEMCSECHPFFTGEQRIVDTAGQVERFERRKKIADNLAESTARRREKRPKAESLFEFVTEEAKPAAEEATEFGGGLAGLAAALVQEQPEARRTRKPRGEPKGKAETNSETKAEARPETKAAAKPETKAAAKPETKAAAPAATVAEPQAQPEASVEKPQARRSPRKPKAEGEAPATKEAPDATASA